MKYKYSDLTAKSLSKLFYKLFRGSDLGHGEYTCHQADPDSNKVAGKASTIRGPVDEEMWERHLLGKIGLGIIPINRDNECVWGAIDIDEYHGFNHQKLVKKIAKLKLPLVVARSKSGGAHVFLFLKEPVPAEGLRRTLMKLAARLGHGGDTEIFPKQNEVLSDRGDLGNWLNMPYQDLPAVTTRYGLQLRTGKAIVEPAEFIDLCMSRRISYAEMLSLNEETKKLKIRGGNPFKHGFPCLEIIYENGVPEGGRNNVVFQVGIQMQFMFPGDWEKKFDTLVHKMLEEDPLPASEIANIKKSIEKKEYGPKCEQEPMCSHCDKGTCRVRKYGIGTNVNYALIENMVKIPTDPVLWFADVNGERTEFESEDLLNQRKFRKTVLEAHNIFPPIMKDGQWAKEMSKLLQSCEVQSAYLGTSREDMFYDLLQEFCTRKQARNRDELIRGIPWEEDGFIYFKMQNFNAFLLRNKYMHFTMPQRSQRIRNIQGGSKYMKVKGQSINVWFVPANHFDSPDEKLDTPEMEGGAI